MNIPTEWTFKNSQVADGFDYHVRQQLPWYELATGMIAHFARHYIPQGGVVYDIGCSTGNIGNAIRDIIESRNAQFTGIDNSKEMAEKYNGPGTFIASDAESFDFQPFDFATCFLVVMFMKPSERKAFISRLRGLINPGGALIIFERCIPAGGYSSLVLTRMSIAGKLASGTPAEQIVAKELSLAGVQRPVIESEIGDALEIFRFGDFAGWVIEGENQ